MRRRRLLAGCTALLPLSAGCLGGSLFDVGDDRPDSTGSGESNGPGGFRRTVSVAAVDDVPGEFVADLGVEVVRETVTAERTARLRATVENVGDSPERFPPAYYKGASSAADDGERLLLYSTRAPDRPRGEGGPACVEGGGSDGKSRETLEWTTEGVEPARVAPGATTTEELLVANDPTTRGCLPPGRYRFETRYVVGDPEEERAFDWGFELRVRGSDGTTTE